MKQENPISQQASIDRRQKQTDRRVSNRRFTLRNLGVGGRRKEGRRATDQVNCYVDLYEPHLFFLSLAVVCMSCVDAFMTLNLIQKGKAIEWNPFMAVLIQHNIHSFIVVKYVLTALPILILLAHKGFTLFGKIKINRLLYVFFGGYLTLNLYEILLTVI